MSYDLNEVSGAIVDSAIQVHRSTGPGLLESVYENCLAFELGARGLKVERQVSMPVVYQNLELEKAFRLDLLVEERVIVEVKAVHKVLPVHKAQLLTYLKLGRKKLGLLLNFNVPLMKSGVFRLIQSKPVTL